MVLVLVILVLATAFGFLGDLLQLAGAIIVVFALLGALLGFFVYRWVDRMRGRLRR